jgi:hypothetical protein
MTIVARRFKSIPERSALETWRAISNVLAPRLSSTSRGELDTIADIASSLITREAMRDSAILVHGSGPRVRIYCLYGEDAITGDNASEHLLAFDATAGDWHLSLPCPAEDLEWVQAALKRKSTRVTARDLKAEIEVAANEVNKMDGFQINTEAFFRS